MANTLSWTLLGIDKSSPAFQKVAKNADKAAARLDALSKDGSKAATDLADVSEKTAARIAKAQQTHADQLGRLRVATAKLAELREVGTAKASQMAAAEERVANITRKVEAAQLALAAAQKRVNEEMARESDVDGKPTTLDFDAKGGIDRIKAFAISELKSAGIVAGAAMGGGIAAGLSSVGAAGLFIAIAAAAQSSNEKVRAAYSTLWEQVKAGAQETSSVLADDFITGAEKLGSTFNRLKPQMLEAFTASQPAVADLFDGVDRLATQAMPGLVTAAKASALASDNVADAMESAGRAVTNFLTESAKGAEAGGESIAAFGRIVERLGTFGGRILADLANNSTTVFPALERAVDSAAGAVENLATTALPALASGASLGLTGLGLLLNLANSLVTALGPLAPHIANVATSLKLIDLVTFGQVGRSWETFKTSISEAPGLAGKAKAGFTSFITSGLGPLGVLAGVAAFGLDKLATSQARSTERVRELTAAYRESKGAIDDNVRAQKAKQLEEDDLLAKAKAIGVAANTLTDAWLGNAEAADLVRAAAARYTKELEGTGQLEGQVAQGADALSTKAHEVVTALDAQSGESKTAAENGRLYAEAMNMGATAAQNLTDAQKNARAEAEKMNGSFAILRDAMKGVEEKGRALIEILDKLSGKQPDLREATQAWNDLMRTMASDTDWNTAVDGIQKLGQGLVDAKGDIDTTTEAGSKLQDWVQQAQTDFANTAVAMQAAGVPLDEMKGKLGNLRQQFIDTAVAQGLPREAAIKLADAYHLVPETVTTLVLTPNLAQKMGEVGAFATQIKNFDGRIVVTADTKSASGAIQKFIQDNTGKVIRLVVQANGTVTNTDTKSFVRHQAEGGWATGPGTSTSDSIPTMLSNGEFVVQASQAKRFGPLLEAMNDGRISRATAAAAAAAAGMPSGGGPTNVNVGLTVNSGGSQLDYVLMNILQRAIRIRGGNVQAVLGTG